MWDSFRRACPPESAARRLFSSLRGQVHTSQTAYNLLSTTGSGPTIRANSLGLVGFHNLVNFCEDPSGRLFQGHFFSDWRTLPSLFPVFSPAKAPGYGDIVIPSHYYYGATKRLAQPSSITNPAVSDETWISLGIPTVLIQFYS